MESYDAKAAEKSMHQVLSETVQDREVHCTADLFSVNASAAASCQNCRLKHAMSHGDLAR